ncbi:hypothetical protein SDC9_159508 [bioreactor metagenome]|uniref:Uncharacterized protein n=1 Tax=bioreactor metagenome TaxID=1076179 RepID=A0A645FF23_9ZZZZ
MGNTAAAGVCHLKTTHGALVAGDLNDLNDVGILFIAAHGQFDAFMDDGFFLVDTAAHGGFGTGHNDARDITVSLQKVIFESVASHLAQDFVL